MSQPFDVLKRAAHQAQPEADEVRTAVCGRPLALEPLKPAASDPVPHLTRDDLPELAQPVVILPEDLAPFESQPGASKVEAQTSVQPADRGASGHNAQFETRASKPNSRRPFHLALGVLGAAALSVIGYFWHQLQPHSTVAHPSAPIAAGIDLAPPPASHLAVAAFAAPESGHPAPEEKRPPVRTPSAGTLSRSSGSQTAGRTTKTTTAATAAASSDTAITLVASQTQGPSAAELGYNAFHAGDLAAARKYYEQALRDDAFGRDALLGLAAIDVRERRYASAEAHYLQLLERDPRDPYAHAGLLGMRAQGDPVATESRLKHLIARYPDAGVLHFALGNLYAAQHRWPEAQRAYFKAYVSEPTHPDYAFNLAVSLDRLRRPQLALEYYRKALELAATHPAAFPVDEAAARLGELDP